MVEAVSAKLISLVGQEFVGAVILVVLSVMHGRSEKYGSLLMVLFRLPSTFIHESCHLIMALLTFSGPTSFSIIPHRHEDMWTLGSVECNRINFFSAVPVALAPAIICLPASWACFSNHSIQGYVLFYLFITSSVPSKADLIAATHSIIGLIFWLCVPIIGYFLFY